MTLVHRVDFPEQIGSLTEYMRHRGGRGLTAAQSMTSDQIIDVVLASGLRGRGGAGFPTGRKWRTVADMHSSELPTSVVINAAEGEPGTFKDRHLLRIDPYQVIEGALIAARAVKANEVIIALKKINVEHQQILARAIDEVLEAGWADGVDVHVVLGPDEYLFGEESALLEVVDGRNPFPRIAPPYRRGVVELVDTAADIGTKSGLSAHVHMAGAAGDAPPALVNNVETISNVAHILARGADWFKTLGTEKSTGTFLCTVTGATIREGIGEVIAGTPLSEVIEEIGGGMAPERWIKAIISGVSNRVITADLLETPVSYEAMQPLGIGPGSGGFIVFDDQTDMISVAAGVAEFLAIESCGQCSPCKFDGLEISNKLAALCRNEASPQDWKAIEHRLDTVATGARCALASQQQSTVASILEVFADEVEAHLAKTAAPVTPFLVAELRDLADGVAVWDERHADKQADWSYDTSWSGTVPADLFGDHREGGKLAE